MFFKFSKITLTILLALFFCLPSLSFVAATTPAVSQGDLNLKQTGDISGILEGLDKAAIGSKLPDAAKTVGQGPKASVTELIAKYISYLLMGLGALFFALALFAGLQWMLARDNEENVKKSKDLLRDAAVGLAIVLAAYLATAFIINQILTKIIIQQ